MSNNCKKVSVSLPASLVDELDERSSNRSTEIARTITRYWRILELGEHELALSVASPDDRYAIMRSLVAARVTSPDSPIVAFAEEFADVVALGSKLIGLDEDTRYRIYSGSRSLDYTGRILLAAGAERIREAIEDETYD
jgi:hypothetical protein